MSRRARPRPATAHWKQRVDDARYRRLLALMFPRPPERPDLTSEDPTGRRER